MKRKTTINNHEERAEEDINKMLKREMFYKNPDNFCLGKNLEEAAEVFRLMLADVSKRKEEKNNEVGMDIERD